MSFALSATVMGRPLRPTSTNLPWCANAPSACSGIPGKPATSKAASRPRLLVMRRTSSAKLGAAGAEGVHDACDLMSERDLAGR